MGYLHCTDMGLALLSKMHTNFTPSQEHRLSNTQLQLKVTWISPRGVSCVEPMMSGTAVSAYVCRYVCRYVHMEVGISY